jgi:phage FluMu protein Com
MHNCSKCGTILNAGFYVCPSCRHYNEAAESSDRTAAAIAKRNKFLEMDRLNAKKQGFNNLRSYYIAKYNEDPILIKSGLFGLKTIAQPFNSARVRYKGHEETLYYKQEPSMFWDEEYIGNTWEEIQKHYDSSWMDISL